MFDQSTMELLRVRVFLAICLFITGISPTESRLIKTFNSFAVPPSWKSVHSVNKINPSGKPIELIDTNSVKRKKRHNFKNHEISKNQDQIYYSLDPDEPDLNPDQFDFVPGEFD